eukprot:m.5083 g.5083  ORF g.5083 m.5083 type:complete len:451 (+) comp2334_c0_seq1:229-1581(+)
MLLCSSLVVKGSVSTSSSLLLNVVRAASSGRIETRVLYPWTVAGINRPHTVGCDKNVFHMETDDGSKFDLIDYSSNLISTLIDSRELIPSIQRTFETGLLSMAPEYRTETKDIVARTLIDNSPIEDPSKARVWYGCTGSDGVSTAIWGCMRTTDKTGLLFMDHSFHGGEFYSSQVGTDSRGAFKRTEHMRLHRYPPLPRPLNPSEAEACLERSYNILNYLKDEVGVVIIDGSNGSPIGIPWPTGYLPSLVTMARDMGIRVVIDEVMSGLKRCGPGLFAASNRDGGVLADAVVYGKALTNGMLPLSAVVFADTVEFNDKPWGHGSTFSGTTLSLEVCRDMLEIVQSEAFDNRVIATENLLLEYLQPLVDDPTCSVSDLRGSGAMYTVFFDLSNADTAMVRATLKEKYRIRQFGLDNRIMISPTLDVTPDQMQYLCDSIRDLDKTVYAHKAN